MRIIFALFFIIISFSFAHKLNLFLNQEEDKVFASAYFASGSFCKNCDIFVKDEKGNLLQSGKTNKKGEFVITKLSSEIFVDVKTIEGHAAKDSLKIIKQAKKEFEVDEISKLKKEIQRLKSENKLLKDEVNQNDLIKMIFSLLIIAGIFLFLKKVKK